MFIAFSPYCFQNVLIMIVKNGHLSHKRESTFNSERYAIKAETHSLRQDFYLDLTANTLLKLLQEDNKPRQYNK